MHTNLRAIFVEVVLNLILDKSTRVYDLLYRTIAGEVLRMSKFDLNEVTENTKQAREATLVGKYDEAVVFYESVIHMVNRHVTQTKDQNTKQKWQQVMEMLSGRVYQF